MSREIIDSKSDGDDNIYLGTRNGKVIGKEQAGKDYKVGEYLVADDVFSNAKLPVDFYLNLILKQTTQNI